jgi:hypothetical protein
LDYELVPLRVIAEALDNDAALMLQAISRLVEGLDLFFHD